MFIVIICTLEINDRLISIIDNLKNSFDILIVSPEYPNIPKTLYVKDPGIGMATARKKGIDKAISLKKYTQALFIGPDNTISTQSILDHVEYKKEHNWVAAAFQTRYYSIKNYKDRMTNLRWKYRFTEGTKKVIGSPFLIDLNKANYNERVQYSDDAELFDTLNKQGYKVGYSDQICLDYETNLKARYLMYGKGDAQYHKANPRPFNLLKSIKHILVCEWINKPIYLPYYLYLVYYRLKGFIKELNR